MSAVKHIVLSVLQPTIDVEWNWNCEAKIFVSELEIISSIWSHLVWYKKVGARRLEFIGWHESSSWEIKARSGMITIYMVITLIHCVIAGSVDKQGDQNILPNNYILIWEVSERRYKVFPYFDTPWQLIVRWLDIFLQASEDIFGSYHSWFW